MLLLALACKNTPPSAVGIDLLPDHPLTADPLTVELTTHPIDADDDPLTIEYRWRVDGELLEDDGKTVPAAQTSKGEEWTVEARASDGEDYGPWTSDSVVIGNTGPSLVVQISPSSPQSTDALTADVLATDPDDDDLTLGYSWARDGAELGTEVTLSSELTERGDVWMLTVTADDGEEVAVDTSQVNVENAAPTAEVTLGPESPTTVDTLTATVTTDDVDGDPVTAGIRWYVDGSERTELANSLTMPRSTTSKDITVTVEVTPNDGFIDGEPVRAELDVLNSPPVQLTVFMDPSPVKKAEVTCLGTYEDADLDPEGEPLVRWLVDGIEVSTALVLDPSFIDKGQTVQCGLTPFDGTTHGDETLSETLTVQNTAADVSGATLSIGPSDPAEADEVTYTLSGVSDIDGDSWTEQLSWQVGSSTGVSSSIPLTGASFNKGDQITLHVTVLDDDGEASEVLTSNTLTASNTAPVLSSVAFDETLYTNTEAALTTSSSDVDPADTVNFTYAWAVEGTAVATTSTLDGATWFDRDEEVSVTVTPTDGTATGAAKSVTATVQNSLPTAPVLTIDPAIPDVEESLFCEVTTESEDDDGDDVTYTFSWDVDNAAFTALSTTDHTDDTVPSGETLGAEEWTCYATPTDEAGDDGPEGEDSVTIGACWTEVDSESLASKPSGATTINGGWGGHSYTSKDSVSCMWQTADWNYAYIPVTRGALDFERVEVDVYYASTSNTNRSMTFYGWGDKYSYNWVQNGLWFTNSLSSSSLAGGNTYASSTSYGSFSSSIVSTDTWVTLAFVVDHSTNTFDFYVDGTKKGSAIALTASHVTGNSVVLRSGGQAYVAGGNTCWANLAVYEASSDATCFN
jgi:hypothetical protein